jgi:hypothetical protein
MSVSFELDNGKIKKYPTWWTEYGCEGYYPEKPYHTKCGLSFKKEPENGACDHLECAIDAAKTEAIRAPMIFGSLLLLYFILLWYDKGNFLAAVHEFMGLFILFILIILSSISPFRHWLVLREYKNHGTIHGIGARRL